MTSPVIDSISVRLHARTSCNMEFVFSAVAFAVPNVYRIGSSVVNCTSRVSATWAASSTSLTTRFRRALSSWISPFVKPVSAPMGLIPQFTIVFVQTTPAIFSDDLTSKPACFRRLTTLSTISWLSGKWEPISVIPQPVAVISPGPVTRAPMQVVPLSTLVVPRYSATLTSVSRPFWRHRTYAPPSTRWRIWDAASIVS